MGRVDGALSELAASSARRPIGALVLVLVLTGLGSYGLALVDFEGDVLDILPRDDPHTRNARAVQETFPFFFSQAAVYLQIDPDKWEASNELLGCRQSPAMPNDGLDEVYIRGVDEFVGYLRERVPALAYDIDIAAILRLLNWSNTGVPALVEPDPAAYTMPGTDCVGAFQFHAAWQGVTQFPQVEEEFSADHRTTEVALVFDPEGAGVSHEQIGRALIQALEDYPAWAEQEGRFQAFHWDRVAAEGLVIVDAHAAQVTLEDLATLAPIAFLGVVGLLWLAFRSFKVVVAATTTLVVAFVWSTGLLGLLGIPLANLNLAYAPVILGVGLDYSIHMINAVLTRLRLGDSTDDAFRFAGRRVGIATSLATLTTLVGMLVLAGSPSPMMRQVAVASAVAVATVYVLTFTCLPAVLGLLKVYATGRPPRGSRFVPLMAGMVRRNKVVAGALLVVTIAASIAAVPRVEMAAFGDPELQFPEGDLVRGWHETVDESFFLGEPTGNAFFVVSGDIQTPEAHEHIIALGDAWAASELGGERIAHLPRLIDAYLTIKDGTGGAAVHTALAGIPVPPFGPYYDYPQSEQEIRDTLDEIFQTPFANFTGFFAQPPQYGITVITAEVAHGDSYQEAVRVWEGMDTIVAQAQTEAPTPAGVQITYFGNAPFSRLFIEEQVPWLNTLLAVVSGLVLALVAVVTRSWRAAVAVAGVALGGSLAWAGVLWLLEIPFSPLLFLPVVILIAVGTDDAIHLALGVHRDGDAAYPAVGKAITFTTLTSLLAFGLFTRMQHLGVADSMLATALAVAVSYVFTVVLVPLLAARQGSQT